MIENSFIVMAAVSAGLMMSAGFLLVADRRKRAHKTRVAGVISLYAPAVISDSNTGAGFATKLMLSGSARRLFNILNIDPMRQDLYPAPWPLLVGGVTIAVTAMTGIVEMMLGPVAWMPLPFAWVFVTRWLFASFRARHANLLYTQFPDALTVIVRSVRAGLPVPEALRVVAEEAQLPTTIKFGQLYDDLRLGGSLPEALMKLASRTTLLEYRFFAVSLALQSQSGGNLSEALESLADVIRKRVALKDRAIALTAEAKMTMYVLAALPFITTAALVIISPEYVSQLFYTPAGHTLLAVGISLLTAGIVSMRVIIAKASQITEGVLLGAVALSLVALAAVVVALPAVQRNAGVASRLRTVRDGGTPDDRPVDALTAWMRPFGIVGRAVINSGVLSHKVLNDLEQTVAAAGHRSGPAFRSSSAPRLPC